MGVESSASLEQEPRRYTRRGGSELVGKGARKGLREADATRKVSLYSIISGLVIAAAGFLPRDVFTVAMVFFSIVFAMGWARYIDKLVGISALLNPYAIAITGIAAALFTRFMHDLGYAVLVIALSIVLAFVADMLRPVPRENSLLSIAGTVCGSFIVSLGGCWIGLCDNRLWHEATIPTGILIAAVALVGLAVRSRRVYTTMVVVMGAVFGVAVAFLLGMFLDIHHRGIILFPSLPGAETHQQWYVVATCLIFGVFIGFILVFSSMFYYFTDRVIVPIEQMAFGIMPILLCGLPLYIFVRIVGT